SDLLARDGVVEAEAHAFAKGGVVAQGVVHLEPGGGVDEGVVERLPHQVGGGGKLEEVTQAGFGDAVTQRPAHMHDVGVSGQDVTINRGVQGGTGRALVSG